ACPERAAAVVPGEAFRSAASRSCPDWGGILRGPVLHGAPARTGCAHRDLALLDPRHSRQPASQPVLTMAVPAPSRRAHLHSRRLWKTHIFSVAALERTP